MHNWEKAAHWSGFGRTHRKSVPSSQKCNILVERDWRIGAPYFLLQQMQRRCYTALHEPENVLHQENHLQKDVFKQLEGHQVFHKVSHKTVIILLMEGKSIAMWADSSKQTNIVRSRNFFSNWSPVNIVDSRYSYSIVN